MRRTVPALAAALAAVLAGCGDRAPIREGGEATGDGLTVYVLAPATAEGRAVVRGAKEALGRAGGRAAGETVQFAWQPEPPGGAEAEAGAVREVVRDTTAIAVIGGLEPRTLRVSAPLLNAAGLLQVTPAAPARVAQPAARRSLFALGRAGARRATARDGDAAMSAVLAALRRAGDRAAVRSAVIRAFRPPPAPG